MTAYHHGQMTASHDPEELPVSTEYHLAPTLAAAARELMDNISFVHPHGWLVHAGQAPAWVANAVASRVLEPVLALHTEDEGRCTHCLEPCDCLADFDEARVADCPHGNAEWPCATIRALENRP